MKTIVLGVKDSIQLAARGVRVLHDLAPRLRGRVSISLLSRRRGGFWELCGGKSASTVGRRNATRVGAVLVAVGACAAPTAVVLVERAPVAAASTYVLSSPPKASFDWFPLYPRVRERFTLVSTSSDLASPIVAFAWDTSGNGSLGEFQAGGPSTSAAFTTPGSHVVRLRVTSADHQSSIADETIQVRPPAVGVLRPFPTVLIVGRPLASGVKLRLLAVKAPAKDAITVICRGHGCPVRTARRTAASVRGRVALVAFPRFERFLPAGVTLEIRVSRGASIGAYTRFSVRRHRLPLRVDSCLDPSGRRPIACPSA
jgi:hypothetical protein